MYSKRFIALLTPAVILCSAAQANEPLTTEPAHQGPKVLRKGLSQLVDKLEVRGFIEGAPWAQVVDAVDLKTGHRCFATLTAISLLTSGSKNFDTEEAFVQKFQKYASTYGIVTGSESKLQSECVSGLTHLWRAHNTGDSITWYIEPLIAELNIVKDGIDPQNTNHIAVLDSTIQLLRAKQVTVEAIRAAKAAADSIGIIVSKVGGLCTSS